MNIVIKVFLKSLVLLTLVNFSLINNTVESKTIDHAVGFYLTANGQDYINQNIFKVLNKLNIEIENFSKEIVQKSTGTKTIDEIIPDNPKINRLFKQVKYYFRQFFYSQSIVLKNTHNLNIKLDKINLLLDWSDINFRFNFDQNDITQLQLTLDINIKNFNVKVEKARVYDSQHEFIGEVGANNIELKLSEKSAPIEIHIPISLKVNEREELKVDINSISSNIEDTDIELNYDRKLILPEVKVFSNGYYTKLRLSEVERHLRRYKSKLISGLQTAISDYLSSDLSKILSSNIEKESLNTFKSISEISPLAAPNDYVTKMKYRIFPQQIGRKGRNLHLAFGVDLRDPTYSRDLEIPELENNMWGIRKRTIDQYSHNSDAIITLGQGFINKLISLSTRRGYYRTIKSGSGKTYRLFDKPIIKIMGTLPKHHLVPPVVKLKILYNTSGLLESFVVKNPIELEFDLKLDFPIIDNKAQIVVSAIDYNSVYVSRESARFEVFWPKIISSAKETLKEMESDLVGMTLSDELPIPTSFNGIQMELLEATTDPSGHIVIFMNFPRL